MLEESVWEGLRAGIIINEVVIRKSLGANIISSAGREEKVRNYRTL